MALSIGQYNVTPPTLADGAQAGLRLNADGSLVASSGNTPANPVPVAQVTGTGTAKGGTITAGGTAQSLAVANTSRRTFQLQNGSAGDLWINETGGAAAIGNSASYQIASGGTFTASTNQALSIIGATTGQAFTATETV